MIRDPLARNIPESPSNRGGSSMPGFGSHSSNYPPGRNQMVHATGGQWTMATNRGPNAINPPPNYQQDSAYYRERQAFDWASQNKSGATAAGGQVGGSWGSGGGVAAAARVPTQYGTASQPYVGMTSATSNPGGGGGTAVSDGQYEKNLILELCPPGGVKAEPPPDKLQKFTAAIPSLNPDLVCPALLDCLEEGQPWVKRAKALCVMERCVEVGVGEDGVNRYADFFHECRAEIEPLAAHNRPPIYNPARRLLQLLGIATPPVGTATTRTTTAPPPRPAPVPAAPAPDLLDFGAPTPAAAPPPPPAAAPPAAPPAPADSSSLFGGLKVQPSKSNEEKPPAPVAAAPQTSGLLEAMTPAPAAPTSAFGFMQETAPAPAPPAPAPAAPTGSAFGFMQESTPAPAPAAPAPAAPTEPATSGGSAFGFMQQPTETPAAAPPAVAAPSPSTSKATFDPMALNYQPSPNTQRQAMQQLNPAQLQAMYATQNMMMMQQQLQQMQLAMAMQQQGGKAGLPNAPTMPTPPQQQRKVSNPNVMAGAANFAATTSFSFLDVGAQPPDSKKKEDKQFDFIKDAMKDESHR